MSDHLSNSELKRWAAVRADDAGGLSREVLVLRARVAKLETLLKTCADELEEQVEARYAKTKPHLERQYERDIEPVRQARAALKDAPQ